MCRRNHECRTSFPTMTQRKLGSRLHDVGDPAVAVATRDARLPNVTRQQFERSTRTFLNL